MRAIDAIVWHCSATPDGKWFSAKDIDKWHKARGWRKIGYHRVILLDGLVEIGRELWEVGAHVAGQNSRSIGVCMIGTRRFTFAQWGAAATLAGDLLVQFPGAKLLGHRDYSPDQNGDGIIEPWEFMKECPGFDVAAWRAGGFQPPAGHVLEED